MDLHELVTFVSSSQREDWNHIICWGTSSGPSYRNLFSFYEAYEGSEHVLRTDSHSNVAAYIPNPSITLAYGLRWMENFSEPWTRLFPDPTASASFADIFFNGALVFRTEYVTVDGGRTMLPMPPSRGKLSIPRSQAQFIELLDRFGKVSSFDEDFRRAGMSVSDEVWPRFNKIETGR
jgi:hypothetical protein